MSLPKIADKLGPEGVVGKNHRDKRKDLVRLRELKRIPQRHETVGIGCT